MSSCETRRPHSLSNTLTSKKLLTKLGREKAEDVGELVEYE